MQPVEIVAVGAVSALGRGAAAFAVGPLGAVPSSAVTTDPELTVAGLGRPRAARVADVPRGPDRAEALLGIALDELTRDLDAALPDWRARKTGLVLGTSAGGIPSLVEVFEARDRGEAPPVECARGAPYFGPLRALHALRPASTVQVLAACASSTVALGIASRWLEAGHVELAIAGGYDALSVFVAAGFEALGAVSASLPQPFRATRDGMLLGEGAALLALVRADRARSPGARSYGFLLGFGASSDAMHVTAPDPSGSGLRRAAEAALADAGMEPREVALVSAHATATPYNDAAEARAIADLFGPHGERVVVHPFKAVIGHTLGAAGALELLAALSSLRQRLLPAAFGAGAYDDGFRPRLLAENQPAPADATACLKLSAAFGGSNAALVAAISARAGAPCRQHAVHLLALGSEQRALDPELARRSTKLDAERVTRLDPLSELVLAAALDLLGELDETLPEGTGLVLGTSAATLEIDDVYDRRRRSRGARFAEPRRFPATSPNLAPGQVSIALGLRGPALTVGAGRDPVREALLVAHDLVASGDAPAMLVVVAEHVGPAVEATWRAAGWPVPRTGSAAVLIGRAGGLGRLELAEWRLDPPVAAPLSGDGAALLALARRAAGITSLPV